MEKTIALHNFTRISEDELLTVFKETGLPIANFTTRVETEKGMQVLTLYVEPKRDISAKRVENNVHEKLYEIDADYRDLVEFFKYKPIRVQVVPQEVFAKYLEQKIGGVPKVEESK